MGKLSEAFCTGTTSPEALTVFEAAGGLLFRTTVGIRIGVEFPLQAVRSRANKINIKKRNLFIL
jgi:hypothetical protein